MQSKEIVKFKVAFDFDSTLVDHLHSKKIQTLVSILILGGADVWIITSRSPDHKNEDVFKLCDKLGISKHKVILTNGAFKVNEFIRGGFDIIFDDQWGEIQKIHESGNCGLMVGFNVFDLLCDVRDIDDIRKTFLDIE